MVCKGFEDRKDQLSTTLRLKKRSQERRRVLTIVAGGVKEQALSITLRSAPGEKLPPCLHITHRPSWFYLGGIEWRLRLQRFLHFTDLSAKCEPPRAFVRSLLAAFMHISLWHFREPNYLYKSYAEARSNPDPRWGGTNQGEPLIVRLQDWSWANVAIFASNPRGTRVRITNRGMMAQSR